MERDTIEVILWALFVFFVGCTIGCLLRRASYDDAEALEGAFSGGSYHSLPRVDVSGTRAPPTASAAANLPPAEPFEVAVELDDMPATARPVRPRGLQQARGSRADALQRLSGVGPQIEATLHALGVYHFDQIAAFTVEEVAWVNDHLHFRGRIEREHWILQARLLAAGNEAEFDRLYGTGGLKDASGASRPGTATRR